MFKSKPVRLLHTVTLNPLLIPIRLIGGSLLGGSHCTIYQMVLVVRLTVDTINGRVAVINAAINRATNCMISCNNTGILLLTPDSTDVDVGQTSEPAGNASIKIWMNSTTGGLIVKNNTRSTKVIKVYYM